jgi:hypothetical protein
MSVVSFKFSSDVTLFLLKYSISLMFGGEFDGGHYEDFLPVNVKERSDFITKTVL